VGLQRVGGDHGPGEVEIGQQRDEGGDFFGRAADLALGQHRASGVVHAGQQVHRAVVSVTAWRGRAGAAQGLAVDGDGPPPVWGLARVPVRVPAGQPGADGSG
jgi:hypothetical protein